MPGSPFVTSSQRAAVHRPEHAAVGRAEGRERAVRGEAAGVDVVGEPRHALCAYERRVTVQGLVVRVALRP
jgi:hypothetical protein